MLNIDDRIFETVTESEFWLMCHIAKRLGKNDFCWPSNKLLCIDTKWSLSKLQEVKKECIKKGFIRSIQRNDKDGQTTNAYTVETSFLAVYVNLRGKGDLHPLSENTMGGDNKYYTPLSENTIPPCQKSGNEVLTNEALINEPKKDIVADAPNPEPETLKENKKTKKDTPAPRPAKTGRTDHSFTDTFQVLKQKSAEAHIFFLNNPDIWDSVMRYRIEIKKKYASAESEAIAMIKFWKDAEGNRRNAEEMIERTVSSGYVGFFPVKKQAMQQRSQNRNGVIGENPFKY